MDTKIRVSVIPTVINPQMIQIRTEIDGLVNSISYKTVELENQAVRESLIKLGWTPPGGKQLTIEDKLKKWREGSDITQAEAADQFGVSERQFRRWEHQVPESKIGQVEKILQLITGGRK